MLMEFSESLDSIIKHVTGPHLGIRGGVHFELPIIHGHYFIRLQYVPNAPINIMPHYPLPGTSGAIIGGLT